MQTIAEVAHQSGASRHYYRAVEVLTQINVTLLDAVDDHLVHARVLQTHHFGAEQDLGRHLLFTTNFHVLAIGQDVCLQVGRPILLRILL